MLITGVAVLTVVSNCQILTMMVNASDAISLNGKMNSALAILSRIGTMTMEILNNGKM
jgi:hypothetical protein